MSADAREQAAEAIPENKKAPCNICERGWPYHEDACAYKRTAIERDTFAAALERIAGNDYGYDAEPTAAAIARAALEGGKS